MVGDLLWWEAWGLGPLGSLKSVPTIHHEVLLKVLSCNPRALYNIATNSHKPDSVASLVTVTSMFLERTSQQTDRPAVKTGNIKPQPETLSFCRSPCCSVVLVSRRFRFPVVATSAFRYRKLILDPDRRFSIVAPATARRTSG